MTYRAEIDGMRAVAVILVILFHAGFERWAGGFIGVDVFFVISGYLITTIIHRELVDERFSLARFYERRARRILPALFLVMAACIPAAMVIMLPDERESMAEAVVAATLFSSNVLFWLRSNYFDTAAELNPLLHTWSLGVEEQFYIVFPLIMMALGAASRRTLAWVIAGLCLLSLVAAEIVSRTHPNAAFYLIPFRAWELGAGALVALTYGERRLRGRFLQEAGATLGLAMIIVSAFAYDSGTPFPGLYAVPPVAGTCLIIMCASPVTLIGRLLSLKPIVGIGLISYSAYLWHQPLFAFGRLSGFHELTLAQTWGLIVGSFVLAWLSWRYVETPFRNRRAITVPRLAGILAPAAALLFATGVAGNATKGLAREDGHVEAASDLFYTLHTARLERIGSGTCHYNGQGRHAEFDAFLENWDCAPGPGAERETTIAVFGDSIAADLAAALRSGGVNVLQKTGGGCSLVPRLQTPDCARLQEAFEAEVAGAGVDEVWVTNWFDMVELRRDDLQAAMDRLAGLGVPVRVWAPLPRYGDVKRSYLARLEHGAWPEGLYDDSQTEAFLEVADTLDLADNIRIWDSREVFCAIAAGCAHAAGDTLYVLDRYTHLSPEGAERYGSALAETLAPLRDRLAPGAPATEP